MIGFVTWPPNCTIDHLLYKAEKLSVRLSCLSAFCCQVDISAMAAWIDIRIAQSDSHVFWHDKVYF